jgi:hypothetical protein
VLDLYQRVWDGQPLGPGEYVISSDEKPSIQARCRCHPTLAPGKGRAMRVEHEYDRGGALTYLAAYDVHRAALHGRCAASTGIEPFMALVEQVMSQEPYKSAKRVFWIVDKGSSHRGQKATNRLTKRFTNAVMVHTPIHASWLNQVEIVFSVVQRKSSPPTTSPTSTRSSNDWPRSNGATTPAPGHSNGSSPQPTSTTYWPGSNATTNTSKPPPHPEHPDELTAPTTKTLEPVDTRALWAGNPECRRGLTLSRGRPGRQANGPAVRVVAGLAVGRQRCPRARRFGVVA